MSGAPTRTACGTSRTSVTASRRPYRARPHGHLSERRAERRHVRQDRAQLRGPSTTYDYAGQGPVTNYDLDGQNFRHWLHKHVVKPLAEAADVGAPLAAGIVVGGIVGVVCVPCGIAAGAAAAGGASFLTHHYVDKESAGKSGRAAAFDAALSVGQDVGGRWLGKQLAGEFHFTVDPPYRPVYRTKAHSSTLYFAGVRP